MKECIHSSTAVEKGIDNTPSPEIEAHIVESVEMLLDPVARSVGNPLPAERSGQGGHQHLLRLPLPGTEQGGGRFVHLGTPLRLCLRPRADKRQNDGVQAFLPRLPCRLRFRPADFRRRECGRHTRLDARGLQASRRHTATGAVSLDDTWQLLSHDRLI